MIMNTTPVLLIPEKTDIEFEQVLAAWEKRGGQVRKLGKYWIKEEALTKQPIAVYGNQAFAFVLAQIYDATLLSPDDSLIARLEEKWTKRVVQLKQLGELSANDFPVFIKSVIPKLFVAGVFQSLDAFQAVTARLPETEELLVSDIIHPIQAEVRSYVLDGDIKDMAFYEGEADMAGATRFLEAFIQENKQHLPATVVVDLAFNDQCGWFVLEFNACWGAGLNGCDAEKVIDCIIGATSNKFASGNALLYP